jgi:hypothetical protein
MTDLRAIVRRLDADPTLRVVAWHDARGVFSASVVCPWTSGVDGEWITPAAWRNLIARGWIARERAVRYSRAAPQTRDLKPYPGVVFCLTPTGRAAGRTPEESRA